MDDVDSADHSGRSGPVGPDRPPADLPARRRFLRIALAALLSTACGVLAAQPVAADPQSDKRRVDQQLAQTRALYEGAGAAVQNAMVQYTAATLELPPAQARLADARGTLVARKVDADQAHRDARAARAAHDQANQRYIAASAQAEDARTAVSTFVASAYKGSGLFQFASIFQSSSPVDLADRISYVQQVAQNQRIALARFIAARALARRDFDAAAAAKRRADAADTAAQRALSAAQVAETQAQQAQAQVTTFIKQRADGLAEANAQRATVLAQYRALQAESDRIAAQLRVLAARERGSGRTSGAGGAGPPQLHPGAFFLTPVHGVKSSGFGMRYDPFYHVWQLHAGVDLAAPGGTSIYAGAAGRVVQAGWRGGYGNYTCIDHGLYQGHVIFSCYGHQSRILVNAGQRVARGQLIGLVGSTGASTGDHLHFEVRVDGTPVQPLNWLDACLC